MKQLARQSLRVLFLLLATALLASAASRGTVPRVDAESPASVRVEPLGSRVDWSEGPFSIRIELSDLDHHGQVPYDEDRDTKPDRYESSDGLGAHEILIHFDPAVLRVSEAQASDFLGGTGRATQCFQRTPEPGQYEIGCVSVGSAPGPQGSGTLATITFEPVANGVTFLVLEAQLSGPLSNDEIAVSVAGGVVEVFGGPEATPAPAPEEGAPVGDDTPTVLDGGELGDVTLPGDNPGPGASTGGGSATDSDTGSGGDGLPLTGVRYQPPGTTVRPLVLGGTLAAVGVALLLLGSRLAVRQRRR